MELTFGVELEVIMPAASRGERGRDALAEQMVAAGVECAHETYNHRSSTMSTRPARLSSACCRDRSKFIRLAG